MWKFIKSQFLLNKRLTEEEQRQVSEGYSIHDEGRIDRYLVYQENERKLCAGYEFSSFRNVRLFTDSFRRWTAPTQERLSDYDFQRILNRLIRYLECWGGEVMLDDTHIESLEETKAKLIEQGIPFEERDGVLIYTVDAKDLKDHLK